MVSRWVAGLLGLIVLWLASAGVQAQDVSVTAQVDRDRVPVNESLTLVVRAEGQVRGEPDVSALESQFEVRRGAQGTRIEIVNGQARQVAEWVFQLMPRRPGSVLIPPIEVAGRFSEPLEIEILPAGERTDAPSDIFIEADVAPQTAYVQAQAIYTLRLFVDAGTVTGRATITPPSLSGGEAVIEKLGDDRRYRATRGSREFTVLERRYAIFPQHAGTLTIEPALFEAMIISSGGRGFSRVQRFRSDPVDLTVQPPVPPPAAHRDAAWLPATSLTLSERWSRPPDELVTGEPVTRVVTIEAAGLIETQIPELPVPQAEGVRLYADRPETESVAGPDGFVAVRRERFAVLPQRPVETVLPAIEVPWFDVGAGAWQVARLEPQELSIAPGATPPVPTEPPVAATAVETPSGDQPSGNETSRNQPSAAAEEPRPREGSPWPLVSVVLAVGWLITAVLWWRSRGDQRTGPSGPARLAAAHRAGVVIDPLGLGLAARLRRRAHAAAQADDPHEARRALLEWASARFGAAPPRTLGALAERVEPPLAEAIRGLEAALYGRAHGAWRGERLAAALADEAGAGRNADGDEPLSALPPLYR